MSSENKITLYLAVTNEQKRSDLEMAFMSQFLDISLYCIADAVEFGNRLKLDPPQLVIADVDFLAGTHILEEGKTVKELAQTSYIVLGAYPEKEEYLDEVMVGKVQFFTIDPSEDEWKVAVKKAFKFSFDSSSVTYTIRSIKKDEVLMKAGDPAEKIFILKKGKLQAFQMNSQNEKIVLGDIGAGEFVGEMAYFNSEPRSASVIALENSEVIEIPLSIFDRVIYQKPAWAMKLIETLSKRLKKFIS